jgi:hypothetical protein
MLHISSVPRATYEPLEDRVVFVIAALLFRLWTNVEVAPKTNVGAFRKEFGAKVLEKRWR